MSNCQVWIYTWEAAQRESPWEAIRYWKNNFNMNVIRMHQDMSNDKTTRWIPTLPTFHTTQQKRFSYGIKSNSASTFFLCSWLHCGPHMAHFDQKCARPVKAPLSVSVKNFNYIFRASVWHLWFRCLKVVQPGQLESWLISLTLWPMQTFTI